MTLHTAARGRVQLRGVKTSDLVANRGNVRETLDGIDELAASLAAQGVHQPLIVNDVAGTLIVTDGHRRLEAARRAGIPVVPCLVTTDLDPTSVTLTMLAAAMHKELRPIEQAKAFNRLRRGGMSLDAIARATGYTRRLIQSRLLLLELPPDAVQLVETEQITIGQAEDLARQVKAKRTGGTATKTTRSTWLAKTHRLATTIQCTHRDDRVQIGGIGCGQCWEDAIRADERAQAAAS